MEIITEVNNGMNSYLWFYGSPTAGRKACATRKDALDCVVGERYIYQTLGSVPNIRKIVGVTP